jgi:predicted Zn-dependent peptidase
LNAFTSKEQTCYHIEILDSHMPRAIELLADVLNRVDFSEKEMEKERLVILDEIQSVEDTPDEVVQELFSEKLFPAHSLGYPILGTEQSVSAIDMDTLWRFYTREYAYNRAVVSVSGRVKHRKLVELVEKHFRLSANGHTNGFMAPMRFGSGEWVVDRPINQVHICVGVPAYAYDHFRKYDLLVLNAILGGGMGSRLFQNIRERYGIAYGIYSFLEFYHDSGAFGVYLGTDVRNLSRAMKMLDREFEKLMEKVVSQRELRDAKSYLKGNMVLGLESTAARMNRLAMLEIYQGDFQPIDQVLEKIEMVTQESLLDTARELLRPDKRLQVVLRPTA